MKPIQRTRHKVQHSCLKTFVSLFLVIYAEQVVVEGNIASGKSTLLRELAKLDNVQVYICIY